MDTLPFRLQREFPLQEEPYSGGKDEKLHKLIQSNVQVPSTL
jgi:hypothetical protein